MLFKALTQLVFATTFIQVVPVDASFYHWQEETAVEVPGSLWSGQEALFSAGSLPQADERFSAPVKVDTDSFGIVTTAQSALVVDRDSGAILYAKQPNQLRAIGSVTKLMTAMVFLETEPSLEQEVTLDPQLDYVGGGRQYIGFYQPTTLADVLAASLIGSDNTATESLMRFSGMSREAFIERMNTMADELGMLSTHFEDPTGVHPKNISTAFDVRLLLEAAERVEEIEELTQYPSYRLVQSGQEIVIENTNPLLTSYLNGGEYAILGGKTGYLPEAGYVLATTVEQGDHAVHVIVMGAESKQAREDEAKGLAAWAFKTFEWR